MIKILALSINPANTRRLRIDKEFRDIQFELAKLKSCFFEFISYGAIQNIDFNNLLIQHKPDILHFSGHGSEEALYFEDENGRAVEVNIQDIESIFQLHGEISIVYFNSCLSENLVNAIVPYVKCIVGSTTKVEDEDAITFSKSFYYFLAQGNSVKKAFDLARSQVGLKKGGTDFILRSNTEFDPSVIYIPFSPKMHAKFIFNKESKVKKLFGEYQMELFIDPLPPDISEVSYYYNDDSIGKKNRFEINKDTKNKFRTNLSLYGDIDLRVTLWKSNGLEGYAFGCNLTTALENYYKLNQTESNEYVKEAIKEIKAR